MPLPTRIGRLRLPVLCFVASKATVKDGDVEAAVRAAVDGGATMVQLRDREMPAGELLALARRLKQITRGKALLIINDRVDVAVAVEADGVQLPEDGLPTLTARGLIGRYALLGRSVHSLEAALTAQREGAEFIVAGTVYESASHPGEKPAGLTLVTDITKDTALPTIAIGGITVAKVEDLVKAGAAGIAVISAIAGAEDPKAAVEELSKALREAYATQSAAVGAGA
jgi:thiamine-phosphate pyrophosphorylase